MSKSRLVRLLSLMVSLCCVFALPLTTLAVIEEHVQIVLPAFASGATCTVMKGTTILDVQRGNT